MDVVEGMWKQMEQESIPSVWDSWLCLDSDQVPTFHLAGYNP